MTPRRWAAVAAALALVDAYEAWVDPDRQTASRALRLAFRTDTLVGRCVLAGVLGAGSVVLWRHLRPVTA